MKSYLTFENVNNCFLDIYQTIVFHDDVSFKRIRRIRFPWSWPTKASRWILTTKPARYFSGFITNGLRHWFTGKGRRRTA